MSCLVNPPELSPPPGALLHPALGPRGAVTTTAPLDAPPSGDTPPLDPLATPGPEALPLTAGLPAELPAVDPEAPALETEPALAAEPEAETAPEPPEPEPVLAREPEPALPLDGVPASLVFPASVLPPQATNTNAHPAATDKANFIQVCPPQDRSLPFCEGRPIAQLKIGITTFCRMFALSL